MKYIVKIESYDGDTTSRTQTLVWPDADESKDSTYAILYAIISTENGHAVVVDDGYRNVQEAKSAWPDAVPPAEE